MDIEMPVMNGYDASEKIIKIFKDSNDMESAPHIVALTSFTQMDVREKCLAIGMKDLYHKPLHNKDLQLLVYQHYFRFSNKRI